MLSQQHSGIQQYVDKLKILQVQNNKESAWQERPNVCVMCRGWEYEGLLYLE